MAIIIGSATQITFAGGGYCVISANWDFNPGVQRLYCIGEWTPRDDLTFYRPQETLSLNIYSPGPVYEVPPSMSCVDASTLSATIVPASCGETFETLSGEWHVQSYSYSREDPNMPGQESWQLIRWKNLSTTLPAGANFTPPTYVMRMISEGQSTESAVWPAVSQETGIVFTGTPIQSQSGSVSAGAVTSSAFKTYHGILYSVGGGSSAAGVIGSGQGSINYTQLYI